VSPVDISAMHAVCRLSCCTWQKTVYSSHTQQAAHKLWSSAGSKLYKHFEDDL